MRPTKGERQSLEAPSTVAGLAFAPKGFRLAVAHYNGVSLWFPNANAAPEKLEWKGSHLAVAFSPDGRFIVTAMQESTMHGWRLVDGKHMRMSGYSARVRSFGWTSGGEFLATSGSEQLILWPFEGKDGPMGKQPQLWAPMQSRVSVVAPHPRQPVVATGYADGMVLLVRIEDGAEILARRPDGSRDFRHGLGQDGQPARLRHGKRRRRRAAALGINRRGLTRTPVNLTMQVAWTPDAHRRNFCAHDQESGAGTVRHAGAHRAGCWRDRLRSRDVGQEARSESH